MDTDDEMGRSQDSRSLYSDISLQLDDSFFRRDSLSLVMNGAVEANRSIAQHVYHIPIPSMELDLPMNQVYHSKNSLPQLPLVEEDEGHRNDKNERGHGIGPSTSRRLRNVGMKSSSFYPARVSRENRHVIQHHYRDHAFDLDENENMKGRGGAKRTLSIPVTKKKGGVAVPFPLKLHELLEKAEEENLTHIVSWQSHGRAFVVHDPKSFVRHLMPRYVLSTCMIDSGFFIPFNSFRQQIFSTDQVDFFSETA
jgi:hypothetical protein